MQFAKIRSAKNKDVAYLSGSGLFLASNLKELVCKNCPHVQNESLIKLLRCAKNLELLDIEGCNKITNATINVAIEVLKHRMNSIILEIKIDHTSIRAYEITENLPLLHLIGNSANQLELIKKMISPGKKNLVYRTKIGSRYF